MSTNNQYPLHIFIQREGKFGEDKDEVEQSCHDSLIHAQIGDELKNITIVEESEFGMKKLEGQWIVQHRQFAGYLDAYGAGMSLTLFINQP